ncbi:hypothetical protein Leryth_008571 [Lithospermum erythrorhizon]|nr:hypothetical protein Leryth_008571 [Lithospermum erythrorhizon]
MNCCGGGVLPGNVNSLHLVELKGPFILQVDEIVNISCPLRSRYQKAAPGTKRCLKLSMTDGVQRVFGMEYRPIGALDVFAPAGMKVAISNVCVRHGLLMLVPEVFAVLGGVVEELEAARERLVQEVNKPPRGKRTRMGVIPPLASRATLSAWPQGNANAPVQTNNSRMDGSGHFQTAGQGTAYDTPASGRTREHSVLPNHQEAGTTSFSASDLDAALHTPAFRAPASDRAREHSALRSHQESGTIPFSASALDGAAFRTAASHVPASDRAREHTALQSHQETGTTSFSASSLNGAAFQTPTHRITEDITASSHRHSMETNNSAEAMDVDEINMADGLEFPYILNGEKEAPFTYLATLSTKWATTKGKVRHVQGMIKGALIGVKRFQYKQTDKYELQLHVDDGSLISEILIDHNLVERLIGHPPRVVAAGIESPDGNLVITMKKKLTQFQQFLVNFEGMMFIQFNESYPSPLVMEMNEGCTLSDAWKLLQRLQPSTSTRQPQHSQFDPIELSP